MSADTPEMDRDRMQVLAERFRGEADQCRRMAEGASSPSIKAEWLRLADEWIKLAQSARR
jgi:hypothetical protein